MVSTIGFAPEIVMLSGSNWILPFIIYWEAGTIFNWETTGTFLNILSANSKNNVSGEIDTISSSDLKWSSISPFNNRVNEKNLE